MSGRMARFGATQEKHKRLYRPLPYLAAASHIWLEEGSHWPSSPEKVFAHPLKFSAGALLSSDFHLNPFACHLRVTNGGSCLRWFGILIECSSWLLGAWDPHGSHNLGLKERIFQPASLHPPVGDMVCAARFLSGKSDEAGMIW